MSTATEIAARPTFRYGTASVNDFKLATGGRTRTGKREVTGLELNDEWMKPTKRFWNSFFQRFRISDNVFRYFEPSEVFERIAAKGNGRDRFQYCIETHPSGHNRLLGVSDPSRAPLDYDQIATVMRRHGGQKLDYDNGVITSYHAPRSGEYTFQVGGDDFQNRFVLECPIDGYTRPRVYLSLMRLVCANGAVGMAPAFRSEVQLPNKGNSRDHLYTVERVLDGYDNGDGYAALRQRFESAQRSWASVNEYLGLLRVVQKTVGGCTEGGNYAKHYRAINQMAGEVNAIYGLANMDAMSLKRQRILPTRCRVYDLLNYASEVATHHAKTGASRALQGYIGQLISEEYDMEGTAEEAADFQDFFVPTAGDQTAVAGPAPSVN